MANPFRIVRTCSAVVHTAMDVKKVFGCVRAVITHARYRSPRACCIGDTIEGMSWFHANIATPVTLKTAHREAWHASLWVFPL